MPTPSDRFVTLTSAADPLIRGGRGGRASDESVAAYRIAECLADRPAATLATLVREAGVAPAEIAALLRRGALRIVEDDQRGRLCERCNRHASPGTSLCEECRSYLGWARLRGERPGAAPVIASAPVPRADPDAGDGDGARPAGGRGMRSRRHR